MRLVYVTANFPYGGGEAYFESELAELTRQGCEILVVPRTAKGPIVHVRPELGWEVKPNRLLSAGVVLSAISRAVRAPRQLAAAVTVLKEDRAHYARNLAVVPKAIWLAAVAEGWGADHIHAHWASTTSTMAMIAAELSGLTWSFTAHRWDIEDGNLIAIKVGHAAFARAISQAGREQLCEQVEDRDRSKLHVIHMGVPIPDPGMRKSATGSETDCSTMICAGNLNQGKGHGCLLDATADLVARRKHRVRILIAGDGPLMGILRSKVRALGVEEHVRFLGHVIHSELLSMYESGEIDMAVLPSSTEGIPVALMEAMSYGIPVVATNVGGIPELCGNGCGVLIPPEDSKILAEAIDSLLSDRARAARLAEGGRQRVIDEFDVEKTVAQLAMLMRMAARRGDSGAKA